MVPQHVPEVIESALRHEQRPRLDPRRREQLTHHEPPFGDEQSQIPEQHAVRHVAVLGDAAVVRVVDRDDRHRAG
jgi:hypothetical protein